MKQRYVATYARLQVCNGKVTVSNGCHHSCCENKNSIRQPDLLLLTPKSGSQPRKTEKRKKKKIKNKKQVKTQKPPNTSSQISMLFFSPWWAPPVPPITPVTSLPLIQNSPPTSPLFPSSKLYIHGGSYLSSLFSPALPPLLLPCLLPDHAFSDHHYRHRHSRRLCVS